MKALEVGKYAKVVSSDDPLNIGKLVSLYRYHKQYETRDGVAYEDVWLFDCNDGYYLNGDKRFTNIGTEARNLTSVDLSGETI